MVWQENRKRIQESFKELTLTILSPIAMTPSLAATDPG